MSSSLRPASVLCNSDSKELHCCWSKEHASVSKFLDETHWDLSLSCLTNALTTYTHYDVLQTGWASHAFVKLASVYDLRIVVVSPVNHFVFTPMLASAAVGTVEYRSMTEPIRVTNPHLDNFVEGRAIGVDVEARKLQVQLTSLSTVTGAFRGLASHAPCRLEPEPVLTSVVYDDDGGSVARDDSMGAGDVIELQYDYLVCAAGTASRSGIVPGAKEHCFNLKTSQDAKRLRTAIGEALEFASRPDVQEFYYPDASYSRVMAREERQRRLRIAVIGGGPTGVEVRDCPPAPLV